MTVNEIKCKSILNKSGIPGIDYAINPYVGCEHKCQYCYAVFMKRFTNHSEPWGDFVDIKINAPDVLRHQVKRLKQKNHISFGTVCDPYQPIEAKYELTRKCLEILSYYRHAISILTKSSLVMRDIDILTKIREIEVGFSITSLNPELEKIFEPNSTPAAKRLETIKVFSQKGIVTWVFVAPLLPHFSDSPSAINGLLAAAQDAGAASITFDTLNPYPKVWNNIVRLLNAHFPDALHHYKNYRCNKKGYEREMKEKILGIGSNYRIKIDFAF